MTAESKSYWLRLTGTVTGIIVGAVAVGFIPRCDDVQTRAMAKEQHTALRNECVQNGDRIMHAIGELAKAVESAMDRSRNDDGNRRRD